MQNLVSMTPKKSNKAPITDPEEMEICELSEKNSENTLEEVYCTTISPQSTK